MVDRRLGRARMETAEGLLDFGSFVWMSGDTFPDFMRLMAYDVLMGR